MKPEPLLLGQSRSARRSRVEPETWALIMLAATCLVTLMWIGVFAWLNARAIGLL
jgi:hypothetical protein